MQSTLISQCLVREAFARQPLNFGTWPCRHQHDRSSARCWVRVVLALARTRRCSIRAYQGRRKVANSHLSRLKFPAPATVETWVSDASGDPVLVVMAQPGASLAMELRRLLPDLRRAVGDQRRVLVGFDRGGWSPALFAHMDAQGLDVLTWRKGFADDVDPDLFTGLTYTGEAGRTLLAATDAALLEAVSPPPRESVLITNADHDRLTADLRGAESNLDTAQTTHRAIPARLPLAQVNPGQQVLDVQTKLISHAIWIAAFNTTTALARAIRVHTGYARANHEAHTLIRQALTVSGDIDPGDGTLTVRLDPLPTQRATTVIAQLCEHLTATQTRLPRHRPHPALRGQEPPLTSQKRSHHVRSPGPQPQHPPGYRIQACQLNGIAPRRRPLRRP